PLIEKPNLAEATPDALVAALKSPERWTRNATRQLIGERGRDAMEQPLRNYVKTLDTTDPQFERNRLEGLWALQSIDVVDEPLLAAVLASDDHRSRAAAVRVLADQTDVIPDHREKLARAVGD